MSHDGRMKRRRWKIATGIAALLVGVLGVGAFVLAKRAVPLGIWAQQVALESVLSDHAVFETDRGTVHRYSGGKGDVMVLIHGFSDSASSWSQVAPTLAEHYRVVTLDLPGHGGSEPDAPPLGFHDLEAGLDTALRDQSDELILVGSSLGGWLAAQFAIDHPERVRRLVLLNAVGASWDETTEELLLPETREQQREKNRALLGPKAPPLPGFLLDQLTDHSRDPRFQSLFADLQEGHYLDEGFAELRMPVDMLWGTPDPYAPVEGYVDRVLEKLPDGRLHTLEGCGHLPQYSCPDEVAELILEVLRPTSSQ